MNLVGEVKAFAGPNIPPDWLPCDGRILNIADWTALYNAIGINFNGSTAADGFTTFALPDLRGNQIDGAGIFGFNLGQRGGSANTTLTVGNLPPHTHAIAIPVTSGSPTSTDPLGNILAETATNFYAPGGTGTGQYQGFASGPGDGVTTPFLNYSPFVALNYIIATQP